MDHNVQAADFRDDISELSKQLISLAAPEELDMFGELETFYYSNPKPGKPRAPKDDPLQFGLHDAVVLVTPAAIAVVTAVVKYVIGIVLDGIKNESTTMVRQEIRNFLRPGRPEAKITITADQLLELQRVAHTEALAFGVNDALAIDLANSMARIIEQ